MTDNMLTLSEAARSLILADVRAFKRDGKRYSDYVVECEVTYDNVAEHVAEFRNTYKATYPNASGEEVKAYATKVRNGLKYWLGKESKPAKDVDWLTLLRQAATNAHDKGGIAWDTIASTVSSMAIEASADLVTADAA